MPHKTPFNADKAVTLTQLQASIPNKLPRLQLSKYGQVLDHYNIRILKTVNELTAGVFFYSLPIQMSEFNTGDSLVQGLRRGNTDR